MSAPGFALDADIDRAAARARFCEHGRVLIDPVLRAEDAEAAHGAALHHAVWNRVTRINGAHRDFDAAALEQLTQEQWAPIEAAIHAGARGGFQYLFDNVALYEDGRSGALSRTGLQPLFDLVRGEAFLALGRAVTGFDDIAFADCQLTRFRAGHFLTAHDDAVEGKNRRAAYVLYLTRDWRPDAGGQLQFLDGLGHVEAAFTPGFNALALFAVPRDHAVSPVAPWVEASRYAVTGWLRAGDEPAL